jgi:hypothetical protein
MEEKHAVGVQIFRAEPIFLDLFAPYPGITESAGQIHGAVRRAL